MVAFAAILGKVLRVALVIEEHVTHWPLFSAPVLTSGLARHQSGTSEVAFVRPRHGYTRMLGFVSLAYVS